MHLAFTRAQLGCGALIGVERLWRARMAGLRTNALVAAGATLFVLYSEAMADPTSPTRVASYVVSGVGFLGGGVIMREGASVRGLNTVATLWCSAPVGILAASGRPQLTGVRVRRSQDDTTTLEASVTLDGAPGAELEHLVARLSLEPGIRDLHWHLADHDENTAPNEAALA
ncbi:MgtC/SapB family protein [Streptomyces sp. NPDC058548]|uniref:MgtC/SapB family protein n=1 Tax=Streptomyces sp. NPDC058548 TaxID=3346545 RepID=UPI00365846BB